jgi:hypothetical protein
MATNIPTPEDYKRMQAQAEKVAVEEGVSKLVRRFTGQLETQSYRRSKSDTIELNAGHDATPAICAAFEAQLDAAGWEVQWKDQGMEWKECTVTPKKQKAPERLFH